MESVNSILIGAVGSIVATIMLFLCSKFYKFGYKERVLYNLEMAFNYLYQIENHHSFPEDYIMVTHCAEGLHKCLFNIHSNIYPFSMWYKRRNKKLIQTLLYDIISRCEYAIFVTVGYDGDKEKEARLEKIGNRFYDKEITIEFSVVRVQLNLIRALLDKRNTLAALEECCECSSVEIYKRLVNCNSFRSNGHNNIIQKNGITHEEYLKQLNRIVF